MRTALFTIVAPAHHPAVIEQRADAVLAGGERDGLRASEIDIGGARASARPSGPRGGQRWTFRRHPGGLLGAVG
ncbi:MAG TPA: hypothetical protein VK607_03385, partial [Kofleriaceae bacterium]|nr:hypothetical protein [Kofleriaceae bacterium]